VVRFCEHGVEISGCIKRENVLYIQVLYDVRSCQQVNTYISKSYNSLSMAVSSSYQEIYSSLELLSICQ
jgi:hypothetical protein